MRATRRELIELSGITAGAILLPEAEFAAGSHHFPAVDEAPLPAGVTAVWDIKLAHSEKTPTREHISLNGLWRWQPVQALSNNPPAGSWGWFKAPGCWPGITDYLQKECQTVFMHDAWKTVNLRDTTIAWYQREIAIPVDWKGRRISLALEYLNTFATVFVDAKNAGEVRFPAGELDITTFCKPGARHSLSILVQAAPLKAVMLSYTDTNGAREVKGTVERRGLCGDVWLIATPKAARITDIKIVTSVSKGEISLSVAVEGLAAGAAYSIQPQITDNGRNVHEGAKHRFTASDLKGGRISITEVWKPDKLWDTHTPQNQFSAVVSLSSQSGLIDRTVPVRFGYREFVIMGKDFYLNGTRIYLQTEPLNNAQIGAAWASYDGAKETFERFKSLGINFL
jgi:beta-galactosidase/beta-glucuronidase